MEIDRVRHDGRADDPDGQGDRIRVPQLRHHGMVGEQAPVRRADHQFDQITKTDRADEPGDDKLDRPEPARLQRQQ